jgi:hypothetical protein
MPRQKIRELAEWVWRSVVFVRWMIQLVTWLREH